MKRRLLLLLILLPQIVVSAQETVPDFFRYGNNLMRNGKMTYATKSLINKGFSIQQLADGCIIATSNVADIKLSSCKRNSDILDSVRIELRIDEKIDNLNSVIQTLDYSFLSNKGSFLTWKNGVIKVAVFNPYHYKNFKIGILFAHDINANTSTVVSTYNSKIITVNGVVFQIIYVQGGEFLMGDPYRNGNKDYTIHKVTLSPFYIGKTEVTQELWQAVMGSNPSHNKNPQHPVETISWEQCQTFIGKLNFLTGLSFRLPTEAEWEFAARGGTKSKGYMFAGSNNLEEVAWCVSNCKRTHKVGTRRANELGLYDMTGNVYEWCNDWYDIYTARPQQDPKGPENGRYHVLRGGGCQNGHKDCYVWSRDRSGTGVLPFYGLRLALSVP